MYESEAGAAASWSYKVIKDSVGCCTESESTNEWAPSGDTCGARLDRSRLRQCST